MAMPLPLDIPILVIEWVYRSSQHTFIDYGTLSACALVCKAWRHPAQRLLFRRVPRELPIFVQAFRNDTAPLLLSTLRANPALAAHVRTVHLNRSMRTYKPREETLALLDTDVALLELCTHVVGVVFKFAVPDDVWSEALEARLRAATLRPEFLDVGGEHAFIDRMVQLWPGLRAVAIGTLSISYSALTLNGDSTPSIPPIHLPSGTRSLCLDARLADWLSAPQNALPELRELELHDPVWTNPLCQRLHASGVLQRLRVLSIYGGFPPQDVLDILVQLEVLVFKELPRRDVALPRSLRHLAFQGDYDSPKQLQNVAFLVAALRGLPELQVVLAPRRTPWTESHMLLDAACQELGVVYATYETPKHVPLLLRHVDWI
ncbi:hypothetical protein FA95DRAFT_1677109 [Auriscalpium vulgare]|uniref:Uncharacterized protein n=1 Tax=Auriscalpium vulgare TaxID=40419 RepID=A0ACB8S0B5_9AGAM|nr:hypothetical protein FA95DRAFT_1677109 [Auriscalpium vulgare]